MEVKDNRDRPCSCCGAPIKATKEKLCYSCWSTECKDCPKKISAAQRKTKCISCGKMRLICRKHIIWECSGCGGCALEVKLSMIEDPKKRSAVRKKSLAH